MSRTSSKVGDVTESFHGLMSPWVGERQAQSRPRRKAETVLLINITAPWPVERQRRVPQFGWAAAEHNGRRCQFRSIVWCAPDSAGIWHSPPRRRVTERWMAEELHKASAEWPHGQQIERQRAAAPRRCLETATLNDLDRDHGSTYTSPTDTTHPPSAYCQNNNQHKPEALQQTTCLSSAIDRLTYTAKDNSGALAGHKAWKTRVPGWSAPLKTIKVLLCRAVEEVVAIFSRICSQKRIQRRTGGTLDKIYSKIKKLHWHFTINSQQEHCPISLRQKKNGWKVEPISVNQSFLFRGPEAFWTWVTSVIGKDRNGCTVRTLYCFSQGVPVVNALVLGNLCEYYHRFYTAEN